MSVTSREITTEVDKAWIAGFMDGEGTFSIRRHNMTATNPRGSHQPSISAANTDREALLFLAALYAGNICPHRPPSGTKRKMWYAWICPMSTVEELLHDIIPYLRIKKRRASLLLELIDLGMVSAGKRMPDSLWIARHKLFTEAALLNKTGE